MGESPGEPRPPGAVFPRRPADRSRDPTGWRVLREAGVRRQLARGAVLVADPRPGVVLVEDGAVKLVGVCDNGDGTPLAVRTAGSIIGDFAVAVAGSPAPRVVGLLAGSVVTVPPARLPEALQARPATALLLVESLVTGLHEAHRRRTEYCAYGVPERICRVLLELADVFRTDRAGQPAVVPLVQHDVAGLAAASREATAKVLRRLRGIGAVRTERSRIVVLRPDLIVEHIGAGRCSTR